MRADLKALADIVIRTVKAAISPIALRMEDFDSRLKSIQPVAPEAVAEMVTKAVESLPKPKDGQDVPVETVKQLVNDAVAALPAPKDGASVTVEELAPLVEQEVRRAVAEIPVPQNGKDADPEMIAQTVKAAVEALPKPQDGKSIAIEDVGPMLAEQVSKAVAALPKPKDGESVPAESVQRMIDEAVSKAISAIERPKDGQPGRDALQLELLPDIDLEKSYPRGTYAKHAAGLWRSFETTKGLHGWECVVEGIADLRIEQPSAREFTVVARTSSGPEVSKSIKVAALVDKGIFRADTQYEAGDGVTWGGSYFIAQKDLPAGKPGEPGCDGWRLAVKRGRDAGKGVML